MVGKNPVYKKHHYVYAIHDFDTDTFYIGMRSSDVSPHLDLGVEYFSSSSDRDFIRRQSESPARFKYEILSEHSSRTSAHQEELDLLKGYKGDDRCRNGGYNPVTLVPSSRAAEDILKILGSLIKIARKERKMSEATLAERAGRCRTTIQKVEAGVHSCSVGAVIECAVILGIPLFGGGPEHVNNLSSMLGYMYPFLPNGSPGTVIVDDDF